MRIIVIRRSTLILTAVVVVINVAIMVIMTSVTILY